LVAEQPLRDAEIPAASALGSQQPIAEIALQLEERRRLEAFAVTRAQHGVSRVRRPCGAGACRSLVAEFIVMIAAQTDRGSETGERLRNQLRISAIDARVPADGREGRARAVEL